MNHKHRLPVMILFSALATAGAAVAEEKADRDSREQGRLERKLDLTGEQSRQVDAILREQEEKHRAVDEETRSRLSAILNDEQMQKLERRMSGRHGRGDDLGDRGAAHLARKLDLTPGQVAEVEKVFADARAQMRDFDRSEMDRDDWRQQRESMHADIRAKLAGILTPEQLARFDAMHDGRRGRDNADRHDGESERKTSGKDRGTN